MTSQPYILKTHQSTLGSSEVFMPEVTQGEKLLTFISNMLVGYVANILHLFHALLPHRITRVKTREIPFHRLKVFHFSSLLKQDFKQCKATGIMYGNFGAMNYGDEAILSGQLHELSKVKNLSVTVIARFPALVKKMHKVKSISLFHVLQLFKNIFCADFIIVGGGGLFCKIDTGFSGIAFQIYSLFFFLLIPVICKKKIYVLGLGFYENTSPSIRAISVFLLQFATVVTVRDLHSYNCLRYNGVSVKLYRDNSYLMPLLSKNQLQHALYFSKRLRKGKINVALALKKPESKKDTTKLLSAVAAFIARNSRNSIYWLYSLDHHTFYDNDLHFNTRLQELLRKKYQMPVQIHTIPNHWHPQHIFSSLQLMDFALTMRLHAAIFSHRVSLPFYAISYDEKCRSFFNSIKHPYREAKAVTLDSLQKCFVSAIGLKRRKHYAHS